MTKTELIKRIAATAQMSQRQTESVLNAALVAIHDALAAGDSLVFRGFGTFGVRMRAARQVMDLNNDQKFINIPETPVAFFKAGNKLKEAVAKTKPEAATKTKTSDKKAAGKRKK